jgi:hypothetical protein
VVAKLDREVALGKLADRVEQRARLTGQQLGAQQHRLDIRVGVVVGEDRGRQVVGASGGREVAGGGEDRIGGVVGVAHAGGAGVDAEALPSVRQELHPTDRTG